MNVRVSWDRVNLCSFQCFLQLFWNPLLFRYNHVILDRCLSEDESNRLAQNLELIELGLQIKGVASFQLILILKIETFLPQ